MKGLMFGFQQKGAARGRRRRASESVTSMAGPTLGDCLSALLFIFSSVYVRPDKYTHRQAVLMFCLEQNINIS